MKELPINQEIHAKSVRLIDHEGNQLGIMPTEEAQSLADEADFDLVLMSPHADPPVARMLDYGKYRYDTIKQEKKQRKNQKSMETSEIRLSPRIDDHDLETKAKKTVAMLEDGNKVKIAVRFRGREMGHTELGREVLDRFIELIGDKGALDKTPSMEGRNLTCFLLPTSEKDS